MTEQASRGKVIYLTDRSGEDLDDECGMKYWWNRECEGTGIVPVETAEALLVGAQIHDDMQDLATMSLTDEAIEGWVLEQINEEGTIDPLDQIRRENLARRLGWFVAYALFIEPTVREQFSNVMCEDELILNRDPLWVATTPDRILRDRDVKLVYREYKSTITASSQWLNSWKVAPQLHIGMAAVEEELDEKVAYSQVVGMMKGTVRDGRLHHPYVYGYYNEKLDKWSPGYIAGQDWTPRGVWDYPGGLVQWVRLCGEDVARAQFPHTEPIPFNQHLLRDWIIRKTARAKLRSTVRQICLDDRDVRVVYFEPRTKRCVPPFGPPCEYRSACFNAGVGADPLKTDQYVRRVPHHEVERVLRGGSRETKNPS